MFKFFFHIRYFVSLAANVWRICPVRLSKLPVSIRTNVYIEDNCFLASHKKTSAKQATCPCASDDRVPPHWANLLLALVAAPQVRLAQVSADLLFFINDFIFYVLSDDRVIVGWLPVEHVVGKVVLNCSIVVNVLFN